VVGFGFSVLAIGLTWLSIAMTPSAPIWELVLPFIALGVGMAFIWSPLAATGTRSLPSRVAGASSGVYNATRQVGAVLGSAGMASFMTSRISSEMPPMPDGQSLGPHGGKGAALQLPEFLREPFAAAMSQSMLLPAFIALFGVAAALFMVGFAGSATADDQRLRGGAGDAAAGGTDSLDAPTRRVRVRPGAADGFDDRFPDGFEDGFRDGFDDDDDYVEYTLSPAPSSTASPGPTRAVVQPTRAHANEDQTEPLAVHTKHPRPAPAENWHSSPDESWRSLLDDSAPASEVETIGFAHNGFHVDDEQRFRPIEEFPPPDYRSGNYVGHDEPFFDDIDTYGGGGNRASRSGTATPPGQYRNGFHRVSRHEFSEGALEPPRPNRHGDRLRHRLSETEASRNRHHRADPDDTGGYGRHSSPGS
jgi:hypothetical protein